MPYLLENFRDNVIKTYYLCYFLQYGNDHITIKISVQVDIEIFTLIWDLFLINNKT